MKGQRKKIREFRLPAAGFESPGGDAPCGQSAGDLQLLYTQFDLVLEELRMSQVIRSPKVFDVCIIGSGAGGGTAAKVLTEGGLNVVMLEAGPLLNPRKDYKEHVWPYALPHRGADIRGRRRPAVH